MSIYQCCKLISFSHSDVHPNQLSWFICLKTVHLTNWRFLLFLCSSKKKNVFKWTASDVSVDLQVAEMYSKVCKPGKKKRAVPGSPPANLGFRTLGRGERDRDRDGGFSVVVKPQTWAPQEGKAVGGPLDDHCYESIGAEECDPAYENVEVGGVWKRERPPNTCATLRPRRKKAQQPLQQQHPPPPPPTQQTPKLQHLPAKALLLPGENLYESIGDLKQGSATSSTTTIFTFNDGMEMYVTGLWDSGCTVNPFSFQHSHREWRLGPFMLIHTYCLHSSHNIKLFTAPEALG